MKKLLLVLAVFATCAQAQIVTQQNVLQGVVPLNMDQLKMNEFIFDRLLFNDDIYSNSRKTEVGDETEVSMAVRYHTSPTTFARVRFSTNPEEERFNNKTSSFEIILARMFGKFNFQIDLELLTDDTTDGTDSSGISLGLDLDSDDTFMSFQATNNFSIIFYPFNFRDDVGDEFNSLNVSRIKYIDGSPATISATPGTNDRIVTKTIPGIELLYNQGGHNAYVGAGVATYLYPTNADFNIITNKSATSWERRETIGYKAGYLYLDGDKSKVNLQMVSHDKSNETGSLLKSAQSLNVFKRVGSFIGEFEVTRSDNGDRPLNNSLGNNWFVDQTPFLPVFSDVNGNLQNWIGQDGYGVSLKAGFNFEDFAPYVSGQYLTEHFVFDGENSAHRLRNNDSSLSHGGLLNIGLGGYFYYDNFYFNPLLQWQKAKNPVFSNATDISTDRELSSFQTNNVVFSVNVAYTFDGANLNQAWWF